MLRIKPLQLASLQAGLKHRFCPKTGLPLLSNSYPLPFTPDLQPLVEASFAHILKQVEIPHIDPRTKKVSSSGIFSKIDAIATSTSPDAKVYVYGGVVRSVLGFIYWYLINEHQKNPGNLQTKHILEDFLRKNESLDFQFVLGLGSDLDILIDRQGSLDKIDSVTFEVKKFLDRYQRKLPEDFRNFLSLYGDVKNYGIQVPRSAKQGGSPIDWLSFPITERSGNCFKEPPTHPGIIRNLLEGRVTIYPVDHSEARQETVARVVRTLLDLPFLEPDSASINLLCKEIETFSKTTDSRIAKTFEKGVRNARFYQGYRHPINRLTKNPTDALALALKEHSLQYKNDKNIPLLPEVLESRNISERGVDFDPGDLKKDNLLISFDQFKKQYTDAGYLYHGTNDILNLLSMFRGTFFVSNGTQGTAAYGRGFYSTGSLSTALSYAQDSSANLLRFQIFNSPNIRILNLQSVPNSKLQQWEQAAKKLNLDLHSFLFEKLSVDVIINEFVIIQNSAAISLPNSISQMQSEWIETSLSKWLCWKDQNSSIKFTEQQQFKSVAFLLAANPSIFKISDLEDKISNMKKIITQKITEWNLARDVDFIKIVLPLFKDDPDYKKVAIVAVQENGWALWYVPKDTPGYKEIAIEAVKQTGLALQYVPKDTPGYEEIALAAVQQNGGALEYVPKDTPGYEEIALAAVQENEWALRYVPKDTPDYKEIAIEAVKHYWRALEYVPKHIPGYEEISLAAVQKNPVALYYVHKDTPGYEEIALAAVQKNGEALYYVHQDTPGYEEIALAAVQKNGEALEYVPQETPGYKEIALEAVKHDWEALRYVPKDAPDYKNIAIAAIWTRFKRFLMFY